MTDETPVHIEAYAGARYPERPLQVEWEGQMRRVVEIRHQWQEPDRRYFVLTLEGLSARRRRDDIGLRLCYHF